MFTKEKNPASSDKQPLSSATLISAGTTLKGDVVSDTDLRIDGTINGNVNCSSKVIIGPTGFVKGHVQGVNADVTGKVEGNISVKELLQLRGQCNVKGNITAAKLQVDPTAVFNGQCQMGAAAAATPATASSKASIVQMSTTDVAAAEAK